jgi:hypothetical protein
VYIKSYELGVLLLPSLLAHGGDEGAGGGSSGTSGGGAGGGDARAGGAGAGGGAGSSGSGSGNGNGGGGGVAAPRLCAPHGPARDPAVLPAGSVVVPLPYKLPPTPYAPQEIVWCSQDSGQVPHTQAAAPPDRHGRHPGEPHGGFYGDHAIGKQLAARTARANRGGAGARV